MKLQKLTIHNLASIDDAVIDFEAKPLSDAELFLITGKTGAGKSTILDAICLALYADTPRLDKTSMEGKTSDDDALELDDPRQLLRRDSAEGFARLTFIGNNDIPYKAEWSVARAHQRVTGRLQARQWRLTNLSTGKILTKKDEISNEIAIAVGEEKFDQFCKTNMLAQGAFTKFLDSPDKDKADILEKITGKDIYSKVGTKIYKITSQKEEALKKASEKISGIVTLSDEQIKALNDELSVLAKKIQEEQSERNEISSKITFLSTEAELTQKQKNAENDYNGIKEETESQEFKDSDTLVKDWKFTSDARGYLSNQITAKGKIETLDNNLLKDRDEYIFLSKGKLYIEEDIKNKTNELNAITSYLDSKKDKADIYSKAGVISSKIDSIESSKKQILTQQNIISKETDLQNGTLKTDLESADAKLKEVTNDYNAKSQEIKTLEERLFEAGLPQLRAEKEKIIAQKGEVNITEQKLSNYREKVKTFEKKTAELKDLEDDLKKKNDDLSSISKDLKDASDKKDFCQNLVDKQKETVSSWAKAWRSNHHKGDICPVCQQALASDFLTDHEDQLSQLYKNLEDEAANAKKEYERIEAEFNKLSSEIKVLNQKKEKDSKALSEDTTVSASREDAKGHLSPLGITLDDNSEKALSDLKDKLEDEEKALSDKIKDGENIEDSLKASRKDLESLQKAKDLSSDNVHKANDAIKVSQGNISTAKELIDKDKNTITEAEVYISSILGISSWENDWTHSPEEFKAELEAESKAFDKKSTEKLNKEHTIAILRSTLGTVSSSLEGISALMPSWKEITVTEAIGIESLSEKASTLRGNVKSSKDQIKEAKDSLKQNSDLLEEFIKGNPSMTLDYLSSLQSYSSATIAEKERIIQNKKSSLGNMLALLTKAKEDLASHLEKKPALAEEDTIESLTDKIAQIDGNIIGDGQRQGEIKSQLEEDKKRHSDIDDLLKIKEKAQEEFQKWDKLNQIFGDLSGSKFKKIAQSYILEGLVHSANGYMKTLSDRYTLKTKPDSFVISVEDAYQGYAVRAASTISGGESFLVSLALALALSDIGQNSSVDTLFIDEGFGTLSGDPLQNAIETLKSLHKKCGRRVGIISHIEELQGKIPVQIRVEQEGTSSASKVKVVSGD